MPADLHRTLRRYAKQQGRSIRDLVLEAIRRHVEQEQFYERLRSRAPTSLGVSAAEILEQERAARTSAL